MTTLLLKIFCTSIVVLIQSSWNNKSNVLNKSIISVLSNWHHSNSASPQTLKAVCVLPSKGAVTDEANLEDT